MVFTPPSFPPFPGDRNPKGEGSTNYLKYGLMKKSEYSEKSEYSVFFEVFSAQHLLIIIYSLLIIFYNLLLDINYLFIFATELIY